MKPPALLILTAALTLLPSAAAPLLPFAEGEARAAETKYPADSILGEWWTEKKDGRIRFVKHEDGTYRGLVTWGARPGKDQFNKHPELRARPIVGMTLIWHLTHSDGKYEGGYVYNPENGDTYRMKAELTNPDTLKVRGYLGISLLGQTQTWTRFR
ncbi:MAG: DUF2147 domain-containing protein [Pseudomonadota bacterium]